MIRQLVEEEREEQPARYQEGLAARHDASVHGVTGHVRSPYQEEEQRFETLSVTNGMIDWH